MLEVNVRIGLSDEQGTFDLSFNHAFAKAGITVITGPSGCGKTSLLRMISGLLAPQDGNISFEGEVWFDSLKKISLSPAKRKVGFMFQESTLYPHMTVGQNLHFADLQKDKGDHINSLMEIMEITGLENIKPQRLSGGQRQRVSLARSLVCKPGLLLLDEPLNAMDMENRRRIQDYLKRIQGEWGTSILLVSHDREEIERLADEVVIIERGLIVNRTLN